MAKLIRRCGVTAGVDSAAPAKSAGVAEQAVEQQIKEIEPEEAKERKITYRTQVSKEYSKKKELQIFAQAGSALAHVQRQFINAAWKYTFLNRSRNSGASFITTASQFNVGIRKMKNAFCDQMIKYLHKEDKYPYRVDTGLPELFTPQGAKINPETKIPYYVELMHEFEELFFGNFDIKGHPAKHPEQFNAFAAFYIMNNFDDLVEEQLDGIINISTANKGKLNNVSYAKDVARQSSVYWAGETHEAKNIENFTSHLAKLIISTIPKVVDVSTKEDLARGIHRFKQIGDQYLTPSDIYMIAGIIKQAEHDFNIIHQNDIKEGRVKPIVFNDNPKEALRRLLNDKSIPVMHQFGFDLTTSLRAFLYDDTDSEYSVHSLFERGIALNNKTLDIEQLIAFELNKNVTPTYLEYSDFGEVQTKNYGKRYQASSRLSDNIRNLAFLESYNPTPIFTESAYNAIKSKSLAQLGREQSNIFQITCKEIFDIDDITLPQYTEFLEKHLDTIKKICEGLCKVHDPNHGIKKSDDVQERAIETANFLSTFVYGPIKGQEQQLKWDANRYLSSIPMTNFDNLSGSSIPVYRLSSALFQYVQFIQNFHKEDPNRNKLNFFVENQLVLSQYTERPKDGEAVNTTKYNQYYTTPAGFMLDAGSSDASSDIDKMHPNDQLFASFMGNWQSLKELGMFACQIVPYSDKSSIGVILANIDAQVFDPTNKSMEGQVKSLKQIINSDDAPSVLSRMDYHYRKNSKMKLANNILKAWNTISRQLGLEPACSFLSEAELTAAYDKDSFDTTILEQIDQLDHWLQVNGKNLDWDKVALAADKSGIELSDNVFYASLSKGKKSVICFNQSLKWMIKNLSTLQSFRDYEKTLADRFLESPEVKFLKSRLVNPQIARRLIGSGIEMKKRNAQQLYWTGIIQRKEVMQKNKAGKNVKKIVFELDEAKFKKALLSYHYANNLIRSQYMDLISKDAFADKGSGKFAYEDLTSDEIAAKLDAIESKRFAGEPISKEDEDFANEVLFTYGESEYSARVAGMAKRMVLYPATIENFSQNTLRGVSPMVHVAIVKDVDEQVWNLKGETHGQEIFDGSGWVSVYYSYMENASLPGRGVKGTKKTLGVHVSDDNSALFKWAEFELNNDRIRRSRGNKYELFNLFKKMHSKYTFGDDVDLTKSYIEGESLTNPTSMVGRRIFYRDGFNDYEILKFEKSGPSTYSITVQQVDTNGQPIKNTRKDKISRKVNSIFDLWMLFGSYNSMELDEDG